MPAAVRDRRVAGRAQRGALLDRLGCGRWRRRSRVAGGNVSEGRCPDCRAKRTTADWLYRKENAEAILSDPKREELLRRLIEGEALTPVSLSLTPSRAYGFTAFDDGWRDQLDAALTAGRAPDLAHGTEMACRHGGCRCPQCRTAHRAAVGPPRSGRPLQPAVPPRGGRGRPTAAGAASARARWPDVRPASGSGRWQRPSAARGARR